MATFSPFLGLKIPDGTDPFELSDFAQNWTTLDGAPGVFVCTSGSRPSWGSSQAGRLIFMTDYRQFSWWNGSTWNDPEDSVPVVAGGVTLNQSIAHNASPVNSVVTFTLSRPCTMTILASVTYTASNQQSQAIRQRITIDGADLLLGGYSDQQDFIGNSGEAAGTVGGTMTSLGVAVGLTPGSHIIGMKTLTGNYTTTITLEGIKVVAFISASNSSNAM